MWGGKAFCCKNHLYLVPIYTCLKTNTPKTKASVYLSVRFISVQAIFWANRVIRNIMLFHVLKCWLDKDYTWQVTYSFIYTYWILCWNHRKEGDMIIALCSSQNEIPNWDVLNLVYTITISKKPYLNSSGYHEVYNMSTVSQFISVKTFHHFIPYNLTSIR